MHLSWDRGYEDYTDTANWGPRYEKLCQFADSVTIQNAQRLSDSQLLDTMEMLEELMRYYCAQENMSGLEPVMRKFRDLLSVCKQRQITGVEVQYLEMVFLRVNAMLYRGHGQHKQGADYYDQCVAAAQTCFQTVKRSAHLRDEQLFYIGWNCIECWKEAAETHDAIMDSTGTIRLMREVIPLLEWVDKWLVDNPGICDQASELYAACAGMFYQYREIPLGNQCYRQAVRLLNALDSAYDSDFYRARAIWLMSSHGTMAYLGAGDASLMLQCEQEARDYLSQRLGANIRDRSIVECAQAVISLQRSNALQQSGKMDAAIRLAKDAVAQLEAGLEILREDYESRQGYYRSVMSKIASRIHNMCIGSKETLGVMYYHNNDHVASEFTLKEVLEDLTRTSGLRMTGSGAVLIQAETLQYLALIACDEGDVNQAVFYASQSADLAVALGQESGNGNAWILAVVSCSLVAEISLALKNKPKAAQYAQLGLSSCDALSRLNPKEPHLTMRGDLEKYLKKANRRFF